MCRTLVALAPVEACVCARCAAARGGVARGEGEQVPPLSLPPYAGTSEISEMPLPEDRGALPSIAEEVEVKEEKPQPKSEEASGNSHSRFFS